MEKKNTDGLDGLVIALVVSAVSDYQHRKAKYAEAVRAGRKRMATTCKNAMEKELEWLRNSGYPEMIGLSGEGVIRIIDRVDIPDDYVESVQQGVAFLEAENE